MKIAVNFTASPNQGGVYQYSVSFLETLTTIPGHHYYIIADKAQIPSQFIHSKQFKLIPPDNKSLVNRLGLISDYLIFRILPQVIGRDLHRFLHPLLTVVFKINHFSTIKLLRKLKPDLILEPVATGISILTDIPTIVAIHDIEHRTRPKFKEITAKGIWEHREYLYSQITPRAFRILVDSQTGKEDLIRFYKVPSQKLVILPFLPPSYLEPKPSISLIKSVSAKFNLPKDYIFYGAKFWPHKNHLNLVKAIGILKKQGLTKLHLVLSGTKDADFSSYPRVAEEIKKQKLSEKVHFLGYLSGSELSVVYKKALALVMPTFLGPTNIPVYEAWLMGTPVIYSDIRGPRDQLGDAGLLIDPKSPSAIAKQIKKIYKDEKLRRTLINRGYRRLRRWTPSDFSVKLKETIADFNQK